MGRGKKVLTGCVEQVHVTAYAQPVQIPGHARARRAFARPSVQQPAAYRTHSHELVFPSFWTAKRRAAEVRIRKSIIVPTSMAYFCAETGVCRGLTS